MSRLVVNTIPLEKQVCDFEYAKKLNELGVKQRSLFYWVNILNEWKITIVNSSEEKMYFNHVTLDITPIKHYSAFTVTELGEILQWRNLCIIGFPGDLIKFIDSKITEANSRAKMLIYLIENKLVEFKL